MQEADRAEYKEALQEKAVCIADKKKADMHSLKAWARKDATLEAKEKAEWAWAEANEKMASACQAWEDADVEHQKCILAKVFVGMICGIHMYAQEECEKKLLHAESEEVHLL